MHLILSEPPNHPLSTILGGLKRSVSKQLPESPFWLPRYYDFNIVTTRLIEKLRYLHRNPVARELASLPADYPWSSFTTCATRTRGAVQIALDPPSSPRPSDGIVGSFLIRKVPLAVA